MNDENDVLIEGRVLHEPEFRYTPAGRPLCRFTLATYRGGMTMHFEIRTGAKLAEHCQEWLRKGEIVQVTGCLEQERWVDPEGKDGSKVYILAEQVAHEPLLEREDGGE